MTTGGGGLERRARGMLADVRELTVPTLPDPDVVPVSRVALAEAAGLVPDPHQRIVLESESKKVAMNWCRQSGKSTAAALLAVHEAAFSAGALVLLLSPSMRQSSELFRKCTDIYKAVEGAELPGFVMSSVLRLELENGSRIIALPGSEATTRGYSAATLVVVDEASRVADSLIAAVRPSLATTNGRMVLLSTLIRFASLPLLLLLALHG